jgi:methyltransferase-like protein
MSVDKDELARLMQEFVDKQSHSYCDEFYGTDREFSAMVLESFAESLGIALTIPQIPRKRREISLEITRQALFSEMLPDVERLFNLKFKDLTAKERTPE